MPHLNTNPIEREVAGRTAGNVRNTDAEVRVREVVTRPGAAPRIGKAAEQVRGFARRQRGGGFRSCPGYAAIP